MAKISKTALKGLIKECLVEILQEGLATQLMTSNPPVKKRKRKLSSINSASHVIDEHADPRRRRNYNPSLDTPITSLSDRVSPTIARVSSDPSIQALLEDTAATTLKTQHGAENQRGPQAQTDVPLESLGANVRNWAAMAFSEDKIDSSKLG
jgi:hypothetical protein